MSKKLHSSKDHLYNQRQSVRWQNENAVKVRKNQMSLSQSKGLSWDSQGKTGIISRPDKWERISPEDMMKLFLRHSGVSLSFWHQHTMLKCQLKSWLPCFKFQLPADVPGKAVEDSARVWVPVSMEPLVAGCCGHLGSRRYLSLSPSLFLPLDLSNKKIYKSSKKRVYEHFQGGKINVNYKNTMTMIIVITFISTYF